MKVDPLSFSSSMKEALYECNRICCWYMVLRLAEMFLLEAQSQTLSLGARSDGFV